MASKKVRMIFSLSALLCAVSFAAGESAKPQEPPILTKLHTVSCGKPPKQVVFSPDGSCIALPLLDDAGFQIVQTGDQSVRTMYPPRSAQKGFAEALFVAEKNAFFISQMTTGYIYEYVWPGFTYRREIKTFGVWPKFISWSNEKNMLAVSNWVSNTVSLIDYETGSLVRTLKTGKEPRGTAFTSGGISLIVLCFGGGSIQKFDTESGSLIQAIEKEKAAMRHIVINADETKAYVSDMYHCSVYEIDLIKFTLTRSIRVFSNPNTIALYGGRWLFVSSRGPNNPEDYTKRSPVNGRLSVIDIGSWKIVQEIEGGNQPTGLGISSDGKYLCSSNFQDANIELYRIRPPSEL